MPSKSDFYVTAEVVSIVYIKAIILWTHVQFSEESW